MHVAIDAVVQAIAGTVGGGVVAGATKEHGSRFFSSMTVGAIEGGIGGFFCTARFLPWSTVGANQISTHQLAMI